MPKQKSILKLRGTMDDITFYHTLDLALLHAAGLAVIIEVCFIDNASDMAAYDKVFEKLAVALSCKVACG